MPAAQDTYKALIKLRVSPAMRRLGLKGSGGPYELPHGHLWALVGFQASAYSDSGEVSFTVNVKVADKRSFASLVGSNGRRPSANSEYPQVSEWHVRLGNLMRANTGAQNLDQWWTVTPESDLAAVAEEVLAAVAAYALPEVTRRLSGEVALDPPRMPVEIEPAD